MRGGAVVLAGARFGVTRPSWWSRHDHCGPRPNASGKSTLLNLILGLVPLSEGSLRVFGQSPRRGNRRVGYMAQSRAADATSTLTGRDYVGLGFDAHASDGVATRRNARSFVVPHAHGHAAFLISPSTASRGPTSTHRARARNRLQPELLLLDEPLAHSTSPPRPRLSTWSTWCAIAPERRSSSSRTTSTLSRRS